ncbi:MAG TPA: hypothetical protein VNX02_09440 [Steroidobacteraceae bacterium]|jgi:hypothetical protein|nr:hypothetical protein [Steroidobacteraceae bacterium]
MWKVHVALPMLAATATLLGCAGTPKAEMPAGASLAGNWKLNHATSEDPQVVIAKMRDQAWRIIRRANQYADSAPPPGSTRGGHATGQESDPSQPFGADATGNGAPGDQSGRRMDPLKRSPMMHALAAALARGDYLTVRESSEQFVLDYGTTVRSFTPGARSVVSSEMGVADQQSGWEGNSYVIQLRDQIGPNVHETYALSADGQHLIENLKIGPGELPAIELKRVYDRTTEMAPRALPTND